MKRHIVFLLAVGVGCETPGSDCMDEYSAENGYDHESDGWAYGCAVAMDDTGSGEECWVPTPDSVAEECEEAGVACDAEAFITRAAAECIAEGEQLDQGLEGYHSSLVYNNGHNRPGWAVATVLEEQGPASSGESLFVDAETGEVLDRSAWAQTP